MAIASTPRSKSSQRAKKARVAARTRVRSIDAGEDIDGCDCDFTADITLDEDLPAAFGAGAIVYYVLPVEPPHWSWIPVALAAAMLGAGALALGRRLRIWPVALLIAAMAFAGFARSDLRTHAVAHTVIANSDRARSVTGWIEDVQRSSSRERLIIRVVSIDGFDTPPPRIRVSASAISSTSSM